MIHPNALPLLALLALTACSSTYRGGYGHHWTLGIGYHRGYTW